MNPIPNSRRLPWVSLVLLLVLVALGPYAMSFGPYAAYTTNSLHPQRTALILLGLGAAAASLAEFIVALQGKRLDVIATAPFASAFLACAVVGWRSYPYWATGVYQVSIGAFEWVDQDPKGLMPMVWIGELWRLPVLLLYLLSYAGIPAFVVAAIVALSRHQMAIAGIILVCTGVTLLFMISYCPFYVTWLMD